MIYDTAKPNKFVRMAINLMSGHIPTEFIHFFSGGWFVLSFSSCFWLEIESHAGENNDNTKKSLNFLYEIFMMFGFEFLLHKLNRAQYLGDLI